MKPGAITSRKPRLYVSKKDIRDLKARLHLGQKIQGRVLQVFPDNKMLIRFKGFNLVAESGLALEVGEEISARVQALNPKIVLKLFSPTAHRGIFKNYVLNILNEIEKSVHNDQPGIQKLISQFRQELQNLKLTSKEQLFRLQHLWEEIMEKAGGQNVRLKFLLKLLGEVFKNFEAYPLEDFSSKDRQAEDSTSISIPLWWKGKTETGEVRIYHNRQGGQKKTDADTIRVTFFLKSGDIGDIKIDVRKVDNILGGTFEFERADVCSFFEDHIKELKDRLIKLGFMVNEFNCLTNKDIMEDASDHPVILSSDTHYLDVIA